MHCPPDLRPMIERLHTQVTMIMMSIVVFKLPLRAVFLEEFRSAKHLVPISLGNEYGTYPVARRGWLARLCIGATLSNSGWKGLDARWKWFDAPSLIILFSVLIMFRSCSDFRCNRIKWPILAVVWTPTKSRQHSQNTTKIKNTPHRLPTNGLTVIERFSRF